MNGYDAEIEPELLRIEVLLARHARGEASETEEHRISLGDAPRLLVWLRQARYVLTTTRNLADILRADLAAANARAERAEAVLRAIVDEDWDTLGAMSGESAADCRFTVHNYAENVLRTRANAIDGAAEVALDAIAESEQR